MTTIPSIPLAVSNYLRSFSVTSIAVTGTGRIVVSSDRPSVEAQKIVDNKVEGPKK